MAERHRWGWDIIHRNKYGGEGLTVGKETHDLRKSEACVTLGELDG